MSLNRSTVKVTVLAVAPAAAQLGETDFAQDRLWRHSTGFGSLSAKDAQEEPGLNQKRDRP